MWVRLCKAIGAEALSSRPEYATGPLRSKNRKQCHAELAEFIRRKTSCEWLEIFEKNSVASGPIYKMNEVFADPQVQHLGMAVPVHHPVLGDVALVNQPFTLTRTPSEVRTVTPECGAHTDEVMRELGYNDQQISDLHSRNVI